MTQVTQSWIYGKGMGWSDAEVVDWIEASAMEDLELIARGAVSEARAQKWLDQLTEDALLIEAVAA